MSGQENTMANVRKVGVHHSPVTLERVPSGKEEIVALYGDPLEAGFIQTKLKLFHLPFPMKVSWQPGQIIQDILIHRLVGPALVDALAEYLEKLGYEWIREMGWDEYGGCYNLRYNVNSPEKLSTHAWGIAIDLNPTANPNGQKECKQPAALLEAFQSRGFVFVNGADWMHIQAATGY
jgi:D-alanyl-D-alanine carboxypeptidase